MTRTLHRYAAAAALAALPALAMAQRGPGPAAGPAAPGGASALIEMRRQLDLTPRQLAALDSIERTQQQRNVAARQQLMLRRDSLLAGRDPRTLTPDERTAMHARLDSLRPLRDRMRRGDSTTRQAALRVLTDSQRTRATQLLAQRRGYAMGMRAGRAGGAGAMGARRGAMGARGPGAQAMQARRGLMQGRPGLRARRGLVPGQPGMRRPGMGPQGPGGAAAPGMRARMGGGMGLGNGPMGPPPGAGAGMGMRAGPMGPPPGAGAGMGMRAAPMGPPPGAGPANGAQMRMRGRMGPPNGVAPMNVVPPADSTRPAGPPPRRPPPQDR